MEPLLQQGGIGEPQPEGSAEPQPEEYELTEEEQAAQAEAEAKEHMRILEAYWDSWDQYESLNAFAVDGHPSEGYNGIYLPAGECDSWPQCVLPSFTTYLTAPGLKLILSSSCCA